MDFETRSIVSRTWKVIDNGRELDNNFDRVRSKLIKSIACFRMRKVQTMLLHRIVLFGAVVDLLSII